MDSPTTDREPPPEAVLIRRAREALGLSPEKAAPRTDLIGASQWRNIEGGKARAKDAVLARMARVVDVSPEELTEVDRGEAGEILRRIWSNERPVDEAPEDPYERLDRLYEEWKRDPERGPVLKGILESWGDRDTA